MSEPARERGARARKRADTRRRIVEAAVELHSTIGPSRTSFSAVARRAGVTRPTVYAYFPDETSLFMACSAHGLAVDPPPDPGHWAETTDPFERLRLALTEMYGYFRRNAARIANIERDAPFMKMPDFGGRTIQSERHALAQQLASALRATGPQRRLVDAAVRHALEFSTWRTLTEPYGLSDQEAIEVILGSVRGAIQKTGRDGDPRPN